MGLPEVSNTNVANLLNRDDIIRETVEQIMKDFRMFGIVINFSGNTDNAYPELHAQLINQVADLMEKDYGKLLSLLYQVDITEKEIIRTEAEMPHYNHVQAVSHYIIVRELKKVLTRHYFKSI